MFRPQQENDNLLSLIWVTELTFHVLISPLNEVASANIVLIPVTELTSHLCMSPFLNEDAIANIAVISVTELTSHALISPLNEDAPKNTVLTSKRNGVR